MYRFNRKTDKNQNNIRYDVEDYLSENIGCLEDQVNKNEELYNEVKTMFDEYRQASNFHNSRDNIELVNTLSKIRSTGIDGADKLFKAKLSVLESEQKFRKLNIDQDANSDNDIIMQQLNTILTSSNNGFNQKLQQQNFNKTLDEKLKTGEINISQNDLKAFEKYNKNNEKGVKENE